MLSTTLSGKELRTLESFIRNIESSFPIQDAYVRLAGDQLAASPQPTESELLEELRDFWIKYEENGLDADEFRTSFKSVARYSSVENINALLEDVVGGV